MNFNLKNILYFLSLASLILFSFLQFSYRFTPLLNSDIAINILMAPGFSLPNDLYAWGQDRGGTLVPMLSHLVLKVVNISPISAVSLVHYSILILGFLAAQSLLKTRTTRLFLAMIWFFPPWHFVDFLLFPFGTQVSLLFAGIWLLNRMNATHTNLLLLSAASILFIVSIWVSDLGILSILLLIPFVFYDWIKQSADNKSWRSLLFRFSVILFWTLVGIVFILYGKAHATKIDVYSDRPFNTTKEMMEALKIIGASLYQCFSLPKENPVEGVYAWLVLLGMPVVKSFSIFRNRNWWEKMDKKWFVFFVLNGFVLFFVMILSHWVLLNGVGRRYFVLVYLFFAMSVLLMVETTEGKILRNINILLTVILLTGFISSFYKFYIPKYKPPLVKTLSEFQSLGDIGLIGEYWNAYQSATPDPIRIKATAHDKDYIRNPALSEQVFSQPNIYVIKDMWMDSFPDTLHQFGRTLVKRDTALYIGACWINRYEVVR